MNPRQSVGESSRRQRILEHHTDCAAVAAVLTRGRARAPELRPGVQRVLHLCAKLDLELHIRHTSGESMIRQGSDSGSRDMGPGTLFVDEEKQTICYISGTWSLFRDEML